ncbi:hypothetical protein KIN20_002212 [Parelaphostrongylus tenuis]|uniref:Uncharacterized protein n=1 Tax=Parelaphostrongylus tenuis TaxID=148309 RepID=A0AAD5MN84_PARTN|nr:hypothetical protein KIN20_002212 [Parelaphostrongylus tenuis]
MLTSGDREAINPNDMGQFRDMPRPEDVGPQGLSGSPAPWPTSTTSPDGSWPLYSMLCGLTPARSLSVDPTKSALRPANASASVYQTNQCGYYYYYNTMLITTTALLGIALLTEAFQDCPDGCDCLRDPLVESSFSYVCRWSSSLPPDSHFLNSSSIRSLQIICEDDDFSLPSDLFRDAKGLHHVWIEACRSSELPVDLLSPLSNLRSLHLYEMAPMGQSFSLSNEIVQHLKRLEKLVVTNSNLLHLPDKLLCHLRNLQVLNVSSNWISALSFASAECVANQLIIADFSYNRLENLEENLYALPSVRQLSLSNNRLSAIHRESLIKCPLLQQLELNNNALEVIEDLPETLIHINLAANHLHVIPASVAVLPHLVSLNLSHNFIDESSPMVCVSDVLEFLDLSWNRISVLPNATIPAFLIDTRAPSLRVKQH